MMNEEHVAWYSLTFNSGLSAREVNRLWKNLTRSQERNLASIFKSEAGEWPTSLGVDERSAIDNARAALSESVSALEGCAENGVEMVTIADEGYPAALRKSLPENSPPVLFFKGSIEVSDLPAVAVVGSREPSPEGVAFAEGMAAGFAAEGWNVVSGLAKGIDRTAMGAALEAGGTVTAVLPHGILARPRDLVAMGEYIERERLLVISQFRPMAPWHVGNAMARNSVVTGLSRAVLVADAGETGGSQEAGRSALKRGLRVYVREHEKERAPGLGALVRRGARVLEFDPESPGSAVERIMAEVAEGEGDVPPGEPKQGTLF